MVAVNVEDRHYIAQAGCSLVFSCTGCTVILQLYIHIYGSPFHLATAQSL